MANGFLGFFKEPAPKPLIKDKNQVVSQYRRFQWQIFCSLYLGYVISYIGRKNLTIAMPEICKVLHMTKTDLGVIGTVFYFSYAIGKFVNGVLADKANVRTFFSTALVMASLSLFCFGLVFSFTFLSSAAILGLACFFWGANGWFQSMTFPPIAKSLSFWFTKKERGIRWSVVSSSHQVGVMCAGAIAVFAVTNFGWRAAFYVPSLISLLGGLFLFWALRDKPTTIGLPEVEDYAKNYLDADYLSSLEKGEEEEVLKEAEKESEIKKENLTYAQMLLKYILTNSTVWVLVIAFCFIYIVRTATEDWLTMYFVEVKHESLLFAAVKPVMLSVVGVAGSILAGVLSDGVFKSRRAPVNFIFSILLVFSLFGLMVSKNEFLDVVYAGAIGFFTAGLQNLIGLHVVEVCCKEVSSAANGFAGTISYVGAMMATYGTGYISDNFGWNGAFKYWIVSAIVATLLLLLVVPKENKFRKQNA